MIVNGNWDQAAVLEDIAWILKYKSSYLAPWRAPAIILTGPPGSGKSKQAEYLSSKY